ncbi:surface antigen-domain-containing protein [Tuber borchii]|uniref:Surface antigen-domain-containing protein n=1 Tax=Tuber borchii TaxID=42251 RepID=A0A2T7A4D0_TUBBO|nr:surface antigen-domain-containing protein [Tuber borchii]
MASSPSTEDDVLDRLKKNVDPTVLSDREAAIRKRASEQYEKAHSRLKDLVNDNSTLPVTISLINIDGAKNTRTGFLQKVLQGTFARGKEPGFTLAEALGELSRDCHTFSRFGIFHQPTLYVDLAGQSDGKTKLNAKITLRELSRFILKTGTDMGNTEGSGYLSLTYRNVFGGAESLNGYASTGTRTRSAYEVNFQAPVNANPDLILEAGGYASSRSHHYYSSHEEVLRGGKVGVKWGEHEATYNGVWRQVTGLAQGASPTVRCDAGDSVKSSLRHTFTRDHRDNHLLPTRGWIVRSESEVAGWGGLGGDVAFWKNEMEAQVAAPLGTSGVSVSAGLRSGFLYPLSLGVGDNKKPAQPSRINDRFQLGGPTDVRGFRECGLGPRDGNDSVGGDVYMAGGANIYFPIPKVGPEKPLRLQVFANSGRLVGLQGLTEDGGNVNSSVEGALKELGNGLPSIAAGIGLVYAHPMARFELNFCLPLVKRSGERGRKGLQLGIGIDFR